MTLLTDSSLKLVVCATNSPFEVHRWRCTNTKQSILIDPLFGSSDFLVASLQMISDANYLRAGSVTLMAVFHIERCRIPGEAQKRLTRL